MRVITRLLAAGLMWAGAALADPPPGYPFVNFDEAAGHDAQRAVAAEREDGVEPLGDGAQRELAAVLRAARGQDLEPEAARQLGGDLLEGVRAAAPAGAGIEQERRVAHQENSGPAPPPPAGGG